MSDLTCFVPHDLCTRLASHAGQNKSNQLSCVFLTSLHGTDENLKHMGQHTDSKTPAPLTCTTATPTPSPQACRHEHGWQGGQGEGCGVQVSRHQGRGGCSCAHQVLGRQRQQGGCQGRGGSWGRHTPRCLQGLGFGVLGIRVVRCWGTGELGVQGWGWGVGMHCGWCHPVTGQHLGWWCRRNGCGRVQLAPHPCATPPPGQYTHRWWAPYCPAGPHAALHSPTPSPRADNVPTYLVGEHLPQALRAPSPIDTSAPAPVH